MTDTTLFRDVPEDQFPFTIQYFNAQGTIVHATTVTGPGSVHVPALGNVGVRIFWGNGEISETRVDNDGE